MVLAAVLEKIELIRQFIETYVRNLDIGHATFSAFLLVSFLTNAYFLLRSGPEKKEVKDRPKEVNEKIDKKPKEVNEKVDEKPTEVKAVVDFVPHSVVVMRHAMRMDDVDNAWKENCNLPGYDPPATRLEEAANAARELRAIYNVEIKRIVSSPFLRCIQTAAACAKELNIREIEIDHRFSEVFSHRKVGMAVPKLLDPAEAQSYIDPSISLRLGGNSRFPHFPEDETAAHHRYIDALSTGMSFEGGNVLVVTHGDAVASFVAVAGKIARDDIYDTAYCCFAIANRVSSNGKFRDFRNSPNIGIMT